MNESKGLVVLVVKTSTFKEAIDFRSIAQALWALITLIGYQLVGLFHTRASLIRPLSP